MLCNSFYFNKHFKIMDFHVLIFDSKEKKEKRMNREKSLQNRMRLE